MGPRRTREWNGDVAAARPRGDAGSISGGGPTGRRAGVPLSAHGRLPARLRRPSRARGDVRRRTARRGVRYGGRGRGSLRKSLGPGAATSLRRERSMSSSTCRRALAVLACAASATVGCGSPERAQPAEGATTGAVPQRQVSAGTTRMADTLRVIAAQVLANPEANPFLNRERADAIQAQLLGQSGYAALNMRHRLADERLRAGQTREAIAELETIMRDANLAPDAITP